MNDDSPSKDLASFWENYQNIRKLRKKTTLSIENLVKLPRQLDVTLQPNHNLWIGVGDSFCDVCGSPRKGEILHQLARKKNTIHYYKYCLLT